MDQITLASISAAETASQLVLGGLFCSLHGLAKKHVEWLGFGLGCWGLGVGGWSLAALVRGAGPATQLAAAFTCSTTAAIAILVFGVAWMTREPRIRVLGWTSVAVGVLWQLVLGYSHPILSPRPNGAPVGMRVPDILVALFLLYLAALLLVAVALAMRSRAAMVREWRWILVAVGTLAFLLVFDALAGHWLPGMPHLFPHAGLVFAAMLAIAFVQKYRITNMAAHKSEQQLARYQQDLAVSQAMLERVQRELGAKKQLAVVGELAAAIAHEVRNPLAIIMNAAAGLRRPTIGVGDRTTLLSILDEETARLNRLVTDLLTFARPVIIKRSSVSILELARRAEGRLEDKHRLDVVVPDDPRLRFVQADANLLRLVFDNLVSNAFQAMPEGGVVEIEVSEDAIGGAAFVRIDISDQGHGMDEQVLARATDPFYTTRPSGTGLGLPIVQRIVEAHGGRMEIDSSLGRGTKVSLFLPTAPSESEGASAAAFQEAAR